MKHNCLDCARWKGGVLQCSKCGQMIALRYKIGEEVFIYIFQKFKNQKRKIKKREDTYKITGISDLLGYVSYREFDDLQSYVRPDETELFPIQENGGGVCETCESENTSGFPEDDGLEEEITY